MSVIPIPGDSMATPHLLRTLGRSRPHPSPHLVRSRRLRGVLGHLTVMKTEKIRDISATTPSLSLVEGVLSLSELCSQLQVSTQTIYDLRSQGRGPRGFRVGRELRFRISEIEAWLARMEHLDDQRHSIGAPGEEDSLADLDDAEDGAVA
jgi:excisionase family DNA binding protein